MADDSPARRRAKDETVLGKDFFEMAKDQQKTNLWAVTNSIRPTGRRAGEARAR